MLSLNLYLPKLQFFTIQKYNLFPWRWFHLLTILSKKRQDFFIEFKKLACPALYARDIVTNEIPMILITNSFSFLSTRVGYAFPLQRLASDIMEILLRVRVRERARLPARCLYRLEEESGGSRGMVGEERACEHGRCERSCLQRQVKIYILYSLKQILVGQANSSWHYSCY